MKKYSALVVVIGSLIFASSALAGSSLLNGYGGSGSTPVVEVKGANASSGTGTPASGSAPTASTSNSKALPFTGADLAIFVVLGAGLLTIGVGLRRLGRDEG